MGIISNPDILMDKIKEQELLYEEMKAIIAMYKLQKRVLIQAVLANGGQLKVDPTFGFQAQELVNNTDFLIGNGVVELIHNKQ